MKQIIVAIDGYSSCGKSTIAKALAKYAGYTYVDTGAMYRAVALYAQRNKPTPTPSLKGRALNKVGMTRAWRCGQCPWWKPWQQWC